MTRLEVIEKMIEKGSRDPFVWYARAMELRSAGKIAEALDSFRTVMQEFPEYLPTYLMAGQVAKELNRADVAREVLAQGIALAEKKGDEHTLSELSGLLAII